jgi:Arc/MetJ-type ribon-helix-helix transcriptional regulator
MVNSTGGISVKPPEIERQKGKQKMPIDRYTTRIHFDLTGELARRLDEIIQRGIVGSKPEAIRQALMDYFSKLDEQQLRRARLKLLEKESTRT